MKESQQRPSADNSSEGESGRNTLGTLEKLMTKALITLTLAALTLSAFAQGTPKPTAKQLTCPVMKGNKVDPAKATKAKLFADHKGRRYFFCCAGCPDAFKKSPEKYANKANSLPVPKKK